MQVRVVYFASFRDAAGREEETRRMAPGSRVRHLWEGLSRDWPDVRVRIQHRIGRLEVGEASVAVLATAPHRDDAFAACRAAIDRIKTNVPIWKKEIRPDGTGEWVDATL